MNDCENSFGLENKISYKSQLSEKLYKLTDEYVNWSANLGEPHWKKWYWWITRLAARNMFISQLYLYICYMEVLREIVVNPDQDLLVVCESKSLLDSIKVNFIKNSIVVNDFKISYYRKLKAKATELLHLIRAYKHAIISSHKSHLLAKKGIKKQAIKNIDKNKKHIVIHGCMNNRSLTEKGYMDAYFPLLHEYLLKKGFNVSTLVWRFNITKFTEEQTLEWFKKDDQVYIVPEEYYSFIDTVKAVVILFMSSVFKFKRSACFFRGFDLGSLVEIEQKLQRGSIDNIRFIKYYYLIKRLKSKNIPIDYYVDVWEMKNTLVPQIVALRKFYPDTKVILFQHGAGIPKLFMGDYHVVLQEFMASPHADIGLANSIVNKKFLVNNGFPENFVKLGPALRYMYLKNVNSFHRKNLRVIGVALPLIVESLNKILFILERFVNDLKDYTIILKPHPMLDTRKIVEYIGDRTNITLFEGSMPDFFEQIDLIVVSDSSVIYESYYYGIPTIVIEKETDSNFNPLDVISFDRRDFITTGEELIDRINYYKSNEENLLRDIPFSDMFEWDMSLLDKVFEG